jgi:hypothetical protein
MEAELSGHCTCGKVPKARVAQAALETEAAAAAAVGDPTAAAWWLLRIATLRRWS